MLLISLINLKVPTQLIHFFVILNIHTFCLIHSFPMHPLSTPLKTSENRKVFWCLQGVEKGYIGNEWVNSYIDSTDLNPHHSMVSITSYYLRCFIFIVFLPIHLQNEILPPAKRCQCYLISTFCFFFWKI